MKEVIAIIRPEKLQPTRAALETLGVMEIYNHRALGRGRQGGLRYLRLSPQGNEGGVPYLPKHVVAWMVPDHELSNLIAAIIRVNQTGNYGDGKILVHALEDIPVASAIQALNSILPP